MCSFLGYAVLTLYIAGGKHMELVEIYPENYGLGMKELIAAAAVKMYLMETDERVAKKELSKVLRPEILQIDFRKSIPAEKPVFLSSKVDAKAMTDFIDKGLRYSADAAAGGMNGTYGIRQGITTAIRSVDGADIVRNVSFEFLQFMADCYRTMW